MSAVFFNQVVDPIPARALSAGTYPAEQVHPVVVEARREVGIDVKTTKPQRLTADLVQGAETLITMGCGDECPYVRGLRCDGWPLPDPAGKGSNWYGRPETRSSGVFCNCWPGSS
jgi:arsenate reductase